ncbi:putative flavohemoprotein [Actinoplanes missouriensis 431]|uniref:nitric oxide dioxygenase n=1 Tax=Actinoplanes missouriensis (strain ATCC 14538 / DSM 43046 / CBS 188.64 / JCM 3121 / NBRC 102363 / NCIMB 12654 / NRRL B-3342 / UNCC 431) TaxID=512565 RepID=I0HCX7_ACTM4|nr:FAD-binding oxidoreductase [Actinoplanes missouriensis]BAL90864.1 putative flavohemoprotein [Actinoplanes missouriensis 431]
MLSASSAPVIEATLPVVGEHLEAISGVFYETMIGENPELLNLFSRSAQATGEQRSALSGAVAAYAAHLIGQGPRGAAFEHVVDRIAHRHCALGIRPEQYTMVGRYLLRAVGTVLGDAVTPEVGAAWDEVYWLFAAQLIGREARLYAEAGVDGVDPWREYVVANTIAEAHDTVSFVLTPADGGPAPDFMPGQYVTVNAELPGDGRQLRQYSLSQAATGGTLRITVRRVPGGAVSGLLHDHVKPGDTLRLSQPYGDLVLRPGDAPLLLISAGVGITPMAAILEHVARTQPTREVVAAHADRSRDRHALRADMSASGARLRNFTSLHWYEDTDGRIDVDQLPVHPEADVYLCGPVPFMQAVRAGLHLRGVPDERIRYEVFGSEQWRPAPVPAAA